MMRIRRPLLMAVFVAVSCTAVGCAQLPNVQRLQGSQSIPIPPTIVTTRGQISPQQSAAVVASLKGYAHSKDLLQHHLTKEEEITGRPLVAGNRVILLEDGPNTYAAMMKVMQSAKDHINLETYIFDDDSLGRRFAKLLLEKQRQGVQVNLIYDGLGTLYVSDEFFVPLRKAGANILVYNPVVTFDLRRLNQRNHRKLLIVDGKTAFTGGINISKVYSKNPLKKSKLDEESLTEGWRDTHVQIEGPSVAMFQQIFLDNWTQGQGDPLPRRHYFPPLQEKGPLLVRAIDSQPSNDEFMVYKTFVSALSHAKRSIHLTQAYFVPDDDILKTLTSAARRGVEVSLIVPGFSDFWAVFHAGRSHYSDLLQAGVKIYERSGSFLHAKTAIIDGVWSAVGSANMDWRSFVHNDEIMAVIVGQEFGKQLEAVFQKDLNASQPITLAEWKTRSPMTRVKEFVARLVEYWL
jgi:cardiolipin synthase